MIYEFLHDEEKIPERGETAELVTSSKESTKAIVEAALDPQNPSDLCRTTIEMMFSSLASESGNLLKVLATGGIYLAGGVALHRLAALQILNLCRSLPERDASKT